MMCPHIVPTNCIVDTEVPTAAVYLALRRNPPSWPAAIASGTDSEEDTDMEEQTDERPTEDSGEASETSDKEPEEWEKQPNIWANRFDECSGECLKGVWYT